MPQLIDEAGLVHSGEAVVYGKGMILGQDPTGRTTVNAKTRVRFPVAESYGGLPGAVADGVTDDGPAFNRAIAAAQVAGGEVYAPEATYLTTIPIVVSGAGVQLRGGGKWNTTILGKAGMTGPIGVLRGSDASNRCGIFDIGFRSQAHLANTPSGIKPPGVGIIGLRIETSFNARLEFIRCQDCDIAFDSYGMLYTQALECDSYGCTIGLQMTDITIGGSDPYGRPAGLYPCQFFEWKGGKLWGTGTATTNFTQAIKSTSGGSNMYFRDINVSGIHSGAHACMEFTNVGPVGYNPGVEMTGGYFEANTSSVAEFSVSGNIFSPTEIRTCFFGSSTGMACSALCLAGPMYVWNSQGFPLPGGAPNFVWRAATQGIIIASGAATWSVDPAAYVAQLSPFGFVTSGASGPIIADGGAGALQLKPGAADDAWIEYYARTSTPGTRSGLHGYIGAGSTVLMFRNDIGEIVFQGSGGGGSGMRVTANGDLRPDGGDGASDVGGPSNHWRDLFLLGKARLGASTTGHASINLPSGTAPAGGGVDGDKWRIGATEYLNDGGTIKSITYT